VHLEHGGFNSGRLSCQKTVCRTVMNRYADRNTLFSKKMLEIYLNFQQVIRAHDSYCKRSGINFGHETLSTLFFAP
jgi:hypothetical protein